MWTIVHFLTTQVQRTLPPMAKASLVLKASPISVAFGKAIRQERRKKGMTQEELAESCGLDRTYISQIERGLKNPTLPVAWDISVNLGINFVTLIALSLQHIPGASRQSENKT